MQINLDDETERADIEALERVRMRLGERSGRATVKRLIREADAGDKAPNGKRFDVITREESARARRTLRKGVRS